MALARSFLEVFERLGQTERLAGVDPAVLEQELQRLCAGARAPWSQLTLTDDDYVRHVAERGASGDDSIPAFLASVHASDLYLACACARGDVKAVRELEQRHIADVPASIARLNVTAQIADEVAQRLRERLLVSDASGRPRIADYSGRGPLGAWMRVAAIRTTLDLRRDERRHEIAGEDELLAVASPGDDPELELFRARYQQEFGHALRDALAKLARRERNLLRLHYLDGLTVDHLGAFYKIHRSSAARWLGRARAHLLEETRALLLQKLKLSESELESLMRTVASRLDLSVKHLFSSIVTSPTSSSNS